MIYYQKVSLFEREKKGNMLPTIDRVRVILLLTGHIIVSHFFKGGPAILWQQRVQIILKWYLTLVINLKSKKL